MTDRLIDDYVRRLEHAAAHLHKARRAELVEEIRGQIDAALRQEQAAGEAAVRNVIDRLGPPEDIVEAAQPPTPHQSAGKLEIAALLALIVPFIGWLVGAVLVFALPGLVPPGQGRRWLAVVRTGRPSRPWSLPRWPQRGRGLGDAE